jgi:splicing factor 3B subunit 2
MNPRLGKIDIDYQVLHDAFFKYQLKSNLTVFGDIYYEGYLYFIFRKIR